jgi:hypothetical protein
MRGGQVPAARSPSALRVSSSGPLLCPNCGVEDKGSVRVESMAATKKGWEATGTFRSQHTCITCGAAFEYITRLIPVEVAEYPCPSCSRTDSLVYEIRSVKETEDLDEYAFEAQLSCSNCRRRMRVRESLRGIFSITRLKLSFLGAGVEIERGSSSPN